MPRFTVMYGRRILDVLQLNKDRISIGRHESADIAIENLMVSRRHAEIVRTGSSYVMNNLGGKNGVFVNGQWMDTHMLKHGDVLEVGKCTIKFELVEEDEESAEEASTPDHAKDRFRIPIDKVLKKLGTQSKKPKPNQVVGNPGVSARRSGIDSTQVTADLSPEEHTKVRQTLDALKATHLWAIDSEGQKLYDLKKFPVKIGTGSDCDIQIPTKLLGPKVKAVLDLKKSIGFTLEVIEGQVNVDGEPTIGSLRLHGLEVLEIAGQQFKFYDRRLIPRDQLDEFS